MTTQFEHESTTDLCLCGCTSLCWALAL